MKVPWVVFEFLRYVLVGGMSFVVDFVTLVVCEELFFRSFPPGVYLATACGFVTGLSTLLCGMEAVRVLLDGGDRSVLWNVNAEKEYHESRAE